MTLYLDQIMPFVSTIPALLLSNFLVRALSPVRNGVRYISGKIVALLALVFWFCLSYIAGMILSYKTG